MDDRIDLAGIPVTTEAPVLVTGATGYLASWIVKGLLDAGVTVHAAVRHPDDRAKVAHLIDLDRVAPGTLRLFAADLLVDGSYADAMATCGVVIHTASPFVRHVADPQRDLVDPAVRGTRNVLESANRTDGVRRVVQTSSVAAMYTDASEIERLPGGTLTEDVWNATASLAYEPYNYSKTLAEREAWRIADAQDRWRLVTINPSLIVGPPLNPHPTSESFAIVTMMGDGTMRLGAPRVAMGVVDVRDVARAHIAAAFLPDAQGRTIVSGHDTDTVAIARTLLPRFGSAYPLPRRALPKALVWAIAPLVTMSRAYVRGNVGRVFRADASKSVRELGMTYRPMATSMIDMFTSMVDAGAFTKR